jgi:hypothetical protein
VLNCPSTRGYGSDSVDNWGTAALLDAAGKPLAIHLTQGGHRLRFENSDGTGLNLDCLDWVARTAGEPRDDTGASAPDGFAAVTAPDGFRFLKPLRGTLCPSRMQPEQGYCFTVLLGPGFPGDGVPDRPGSTLRLLEDGRELGPAHAAHADIRTHGSGRFSHYGTTLYFSAADNSDPRRNGRKYTWELAPQEQ